MVLHHVAQHPNGIVEAAPPLDPEVLGHGDLHGPDPVAIPQRLEHRVVEPQEQMSIAASLPESVDAEDLTFVQDPAQLLVQPLGRGQIVAEGFFHHDPSAGGEVGTGEPLPPGRTATAGSRGKRRDCAAPRSPWRVGHTSVNPQSHRRPSKDAAPRRPNTSSSIVSPVSSMARRA